MPTLSVPEMIVTFSLFGCQWGAMRNPSGIFKRIVKSPVEAVGSPSSTANSAPGRTTGGAAPQEMVSGVNAFFSCELSCAGLLSASPAQENIPATATARNKYRFIVEPPSFGIELRESCLRRKTIPMTRSYRLRIFSISSQITDSYGIMLFESLMRRTRSATGEIELDLGRYELRRQGRRVKLEKKPMELLIFLVSRRDQLVSRQEIVGRLWGSDLFIDTEPNINNIVRKIRAALGDDSAKPRFLETVVGKGYRFVGPVRVMDARFPQSDFGPVGVRAVSPEKTGGWSERSSLAVLPLMLLGKATDDYGVCLGFADALVVRLGNLPGVDVLPTSAVLNVSAEATPAEVASRLGVRFIVRGGIQTSKGLWRFSLEMIDTHLQRVCFTRKRDLDVNHLSDLEDEIAKQIAMALNRPLGPATIQRSPRYSNDRMAYAEFKIGRAHV